MFHFLIHHDYIYTMYVYCRKILHLFVLALGVDRKDNDDLFWSDSYSTMWICLVTRESVDKSGLGLGNDERRAEL